MAIEWKDGADGQRVAVVEIGGKSTELAGEALEKAITEGGLSFEDRTFTVQVDGKDVQMTGKELRDAASLSGGAQRKFQEAAAMRKDAEDGVRLKQLVTEFQGATPQTADIAKVREMGRLLGASEADIDAHVVQIQTLKAGGTLQNSSTSAGDENDEDTLLGEEDLNPELRAKMQRLDDLEKRERDREQSAANQAEVKEIRESVKKGLTDDPVLGMIVSRKDSKVGAKLPDLVFNKVRDRVVFGHEPYGPQLLKTVLQEVRQDLSDFGILKRETEQDTAVVSLGSAPGMSSTLQVNEPVKRVPLSEPGGRENLFKSLVQKVLQKGGAISRDMG